MGSAWAKPNAQSGNLLWSESVPDERAVERTHFCGPGGMEAPSIRIVATPTGNDNSKVKMSRHVARYGRKFKDRAVARVLPPESAAVQDVARELGVGEQTLQRSLSNALFRPAC